MDGAQQIDIARAPLHMPQGGGGDGVGVNRREKKNDKEQRKNSFHRTLLCIEGRCGDGFAVTLRRTSLPPTPGWPSGLPPHPDLRRKFPLQSLSRPQASSSP